ncbi:hypothetical protein HOG98_01730 [bacterium]|nr:hypothetical protein [bacterium]
MKKIVSVKKNNEYSKTNDVSFVCATRIQANFRSKNAIKNIVHHLALNSKSYICPLEGTDIDIANSLLTPCGHVFSKNGIQEWLKQSSHCPSCETMKIEEPSLNLGPFRDIIRPLRNAPLVVRLVNGSEFNMKDKKLLFKMWSVFLNGPEFFSYLKEARYSSRKIKTELISHASKDMFNSEEDILFCLNATSLTEREKNRFLISNYQRHTNEVKKDGIKWLDNSSATMFMDASTLTFLEKKWVRTSPELIEDNSIEKVIKMATCIQSLFRSKKVLKNIVHHARLSKTDGDCPIMGVPMTISNSTLTTCGHVFSRDGLSKWKKIKDSCPECRSPLSNPYTIHLTIERFLVKLNKICNVKRFLFQASVSNPVKEHLLMAWAIENIPFDEFFPFLDKQCFSRDTVTNGIFKKMAHSRTNRREFHVLSSSLILLESIKVQRCKEMFWNVDNSDRVLDFFSLITNLETSDGNQMLWKRSKLFLSPSDVVKIMMESSYDDIFFNAYISNRANQSETTADYIHYISALRYSKEFKNECFVMKIQIETRASNILALLDATSHSRAVKRDCIFQKILGTGTIAQRLINSEETISLLRSSFVNQTEKQLFLSDVLNPEEGDSPSFGFSDTYELLKETDLNEEDRLNYVLKRILDTSIAQIGIVEAIESFSFDESFRNLVLLKCAKQENTHLREVVTFVNETTYCELEKRAIFVLFSRNYNDPEDVMFLLRASHSEPDDLNEELLRRASETYSRSKMMSYIVGTTFTEEEQAVNIKRLNKEIPGVFHQFFHKMKK